MADLSRKDDHPELGFFEIPFPSGEPPIGSLAEDADGNTRTAYAWARAHCFHALLTEQFPDLPESVSWGFDALEREHFIGDWPDGDYECSAYISIGVLFDPNNADARAFAERVKMEAPTVWPG